MTVAPQGLPPRVPGVEEENHRGPIPKALPDASSHSHRLCTLRLSLCKTKIKAQAAFVHVDI